MDRLEQVKNTVTANGMREWTDERVSQAMREYADQQNAELDKMGEHLSAENSDLSSQIEGLKYDKERLRERVEELEAQNKRLKIAHYAIVRAYEEYGPLASVSTKQVSENVLKEIGFDPSKETL